MTVNNYNSDSIVCPVFQGINDVPRIPTDTLAGNGSDIIARINTLSGFLHQDIPALDTRLGTVENQITSLQSSVTTVELDIDQLQLDIGNLQAGEQFTNSFSCILDLSNKSSWNFDNNNGGDFGIAVVYAPLGIDLFKPHDWSAGGKLALDTVSNWTFIIQPSDTSNVDLTTFITALGTGYYAFFPFIEGPDPDPYAGYGATALVNGQDYMDLLLTLNHTVNYGAISKIDISGGANSLIPSGGIPALGATINHNEFEILCVSQLIGQFTIQISNS